MQCRGTQFAGRSRRSIDDVRRLVIYIFVKRNVQLLPLKAFHALLSNFRFTPVHLSPSHPFLLRPPPTPYPLPHLPHTLRYSRVLYRSGLCSCVQDRFILLQGINGHRSIVWRLGSYIYIYIYILYIYKPCISVTN